MANPERPSQDQSLQYHPDSRPVESRTDLRRAAVSVLVGECIVSFDATVIPTGVQSLFPVLEQERDIRVHQDATNGVVGLLYILGQVEPEREKFEDIAKQGINSLYHARSYMTHTQVAIERVQNMLGFDYKPYMP